MKIFYHNDNDGKAAAAVVNCYLKNKGEKLNREDFYAVNYADRTPDADLIERGEPVYIVDYSFTEDTFDKLSALCFKSCSNVYWYDHHKSSLEIYDYVKERNLCAEVIIDMDRSGAMIVYDRFIRDTDLDSDDTNKVMTLVDDYDRWIHNYPESLLFNIGSTMYNNGPLDNIWFENPEEIIEKGAIIQEYNNKVNTDLTKINKYFIKINDKRCIVLNSAIKSSQALGEYYDKYGFAIRWVFNGKNYNYSVYSNYDDIDCSAIARYFDKLGGGHKGAAGFNSDRLLFKDGYSFRIKMDK